MSMLPPTPPGVPFTTFPFSVQPYNNITPVTYRDGETLLEMYRDLRKWLFKELVPYIDSTINDYVIAFNDSVTEIGTAIVDLKAYVDASEANVDAKTTAFNALVNTANTNFNAAVTAAMTNIQNRVDTAVVAQHAAEAARDLAQTYSSAAGIYNQPKLATIDAYTAVNQDNLPYDYEIVTIKAPGAAMNNAVQKTYNGYEKTWLNGTPFFPTQFFPDDAANNNGATIATNGDAIEGSRMTGMQIKGGVMYADWGSSAGGSPLRGVECLAFNKDGTWNTYRQANGDTAAQIIANGADTTYGFGPLVVVQGGLRDIELDPAWGVWNTQLAARTLIGRKPNGDTVIALVRGKTGIAGIRGNECGRLMLKHGVYDAIMLDGGGSTQGYSNGRFFHPGTDPIGRRLSGDAIMINAPVRGPVRIATTLLTLNAPWTSATAGEAMQISKDDGIVRLRGNVDNQACLPNTWYTVTTLEPRMWPSSPAIRQTVYANGTTSGGGGGNPALLSISGADGTVQIRFLGSNTSPAEGWAQIDVSYKAVY